MAKSKTDDGRVSAENIGGAKLPRKSGLADETTGKSLGSRDVRNVGGRFARFAGKGRS
jgi:hypothetical protein